jgi:hypothetical protein
MFRIYCQYTRTLFFPPAVLYLDMEVVPTDVYVLCTYSQHEMHSQNS